MTMLEATASRATPSADAAVPTIQDIIERMRALMSVWDRAGDYRAVFLRSYRDITIRMKKAVSEAEFQDNPWMEALDVRFAQEYFVALDAYNAGTDPVPTCWRMAFDLAREKKTSVIQDLLLGINAHIAHDLPIALYKMGIQPAERPLRFQDHEKVNDLLGKMINTVQRDMRRHYSWFLGFVDRLLGRKDELLTDEGIRSARQEAWGHFLELADAPGDDARLAILARLDHEATEKAREWTKPGSILAFPMGTLRRWDRALTRLLRRR